MPLLYNCSTGSGGAESFACWSSPPPHPASSGPSKSRTPAVAVRRMRESRVITAGLIATPPRFREAQGTGTMVRTEASGSPHDPPSARVLLLAARRRGARRLARSAPDPRPAAQASAGQRLSGPDRAGESELPGDRRAAVLSFGPGGRRRDRRGDRGDPGPGGGGRGGAGGGGRGEAPDRHQLRLRRGGRGGGGDAGAARGNRPADGNADRRAELRGLLECARQGEHDLQPDGGGEGGRGGTEARLRPAHWRGGAVRRDRVFALQSRPRGGPRLQLRHLVRQRSRPDGGRFPR